MAVYLSMSITQNSQDKAANTSNVTVRVYARWTYGSYNATGKCTGRITIDGKTYYYSGMTFNSGASTSGSQQVMSKTVDVTHTGDGTKTLNCSANFVTGVSSGTIYASASKVLTTIPRATTPSLSASSVDMGASVTISLPRASSSFTHNLAYKFEDEGSYTSIATGVGTSRSWTVPDKASSIPKATSGQFTIRVQTVSDGKVIGTKYAYLTGKVPASVVPTVSSLTLAEATAGLAAQFGAYIQNKSKAKVTVTGAGAKGSTIAAYQTLLQGKTYTAGSFTSDLLTTSGTLTVKARVKDSRGRWSAYKTTSIKVLEYKKPSISRFVARRGTSAGVDDDEGIYLILGLAYTVPVLNNGNTASMTVQYKRSTETTWSDAIYSSTSTSLAATPVLSTPTFSTDYQYDVRMTVTDYFGASTTATTVLPSGAVIFDIKADGKGFAIGKTSEQDGIEFGWDIVDQIKSYGSLSGRYRTHDGLLLQWGNVTITPTAADTPTTAVVQFPLQYASTPITLATPVTSVPQSLSVSTQRAVDLVGDNTKAVAVTLTRTGTTATGIIWLAVGKGAG